MPKEENVHRCLKLQKCYKYISELSIKTISLRHKYNNNFKMDIMLFKKKKFLHNIYTSVCD